MAKSLHNSVRNISVVLLFVCVLFGQPLAAEYVLEWTTIDGGGGTSTGAHSVRRNI